jgi:streptomycin 6-kinase
MIHGYPLRMGDLVLPRNLAEAARHAEPAFNDWLAQLPTVVSDLAVRWSLRIGAPFQPGGATAWVAPVTDEAGDDWVLKVGWKHYEAEHEPDALRFWAGRGAVQLVTVDDRTGALLLERCRPGTTLRALPEPEQDVVLAGLLPRLWREPPPGHPFRPLAQMCEQWARGFERRTAEAPVLGLDPGSARLGLQLLRTLPGTADREVLLGTDLHAGNILAAEREPWLMIDPKPYLGDPAYDVGQHLINCPERLRTDPAGTARRLADLLELDPDRVLQWLFARVVQLSPEWPWLVPVALGLSGELGDRTG